MIYQTQNNNIYIKNITNTNHINIFKTNNFSKNLNKHQITNKILIFKKITTPPKSIQNKLQLNTNNTIYYLKQLKFINNNILYIKYSYYHKKIIKYLNNNITKNSIFNYLKSNIKLHINFSNIFFNINKLTSNKTSLLQLSTNKPYLHYHQTFYTITNKPFNSSNIIFHYHHTQFYIPNKK